MLNRIRAVLGDTYRFCFHKRSLIIVSEHKVKHIPLSGSMQCMLSVALIGGVCWASYSTGSYMAARSTLKEQSHALRSIANERVGNNFSSFYPAPLTADHAANTAAPISDPMFAFASLDNDKLFARMVYLESRVAELQNANAAIIRRVRDKTAGRIDTLETIIKETGLDIDQLKKQAPAKNKNKEAKSADTGKAEGGPFIPADSMSLEGEEAALYESLDKLETLRYMVSKLPLARPMKGGEEQSTFGHRIDPFTGRLAFHAGLDIAGPTGTKALCTGEGKVIAAGHDGAYGNMVDIDHGFGIVTRYGHLSAILVQVGQQVAQGQPIGIQGSTGRSTGPHLHYEVRVNNQPINPKNFLTAGRYVSQE